MTLRLLVPIVVGWFVCTAIGWAAVMSYGATAGDPGTPPTQWPAGTAVVRRPDCANVVLLVHPRCPCTRASLRQLDVLAARITRPAQLHVLVLAPSSVADEWFRTDLPASAAWPEANLVIDRDGAEAQRFGITVSGHVLVYDGSGRLTFSGGITGSRGHEGDNAGCDAAVAAIDGRTDGASRAPVFGCSIVGDCACAAGER